MFKENKYTKVYLAIVQRAKGRKCKTYIERHHILPKCMGGTNDPLNIVELTAREHFICHLLLIRMVSDEYRSKVVYAAWQQSRPSKNKTVKVTSRVYAYLRQQMSESYTGQKRPKFSPEARKNISEGHKGEKNHMFGKIRTKEEKELMSINRTGKCVGKDNSFFGKTHTDEFKAAQSIRTTERFKGVPKTRVCCLYCKKDVAVGIFGRYHGDKCKLRN